MALNLLKKSEIGSRTFTYAEHDANFTAIENAANGYQAPPTGALCVSMSGADTSAGTESAPLRTIAAARALMTNSSILALERGGCWRESIDVSSLTGTAITSYGRTDRPLPLLDGSSVAQAVMWTKTSGRTNVYQVTWPHSITNGYAYVWEDDVPLLKVADQATCDSTPGSFVNPGLLSVPGSVTVYVHASDSSSPRSNLKRYEINKRGMLIKDSATGSVSAVWARRAGASDGAIQTANGSFLLVTEGHKHHLWNLAGGTMDSCVAYRTLDFANSTQFITYTDGASATNTTYRDCYVRGSGNAGMVGFYSHTAGGGAKIAQITHENSYVYGVTSPIAAADTTALSVSGLWAEECPQAIALYTGTLTADNITWIPEAGAPMFLSGSYTAIEAPDGGTVSNLKAYMAVATFNGVVKAANSSLRITQSTIISATSGNVTFSVSSADNQTLRLDRSVLYGVNRIAYFAQANSDLATGTDYNVYYTDGNVANTLKGTDYASVALYKAARATLDQNSVTTDPGVECSPLQGEWPQAVTVAGQTAGAVKTQTRPDWARLKASWDRGFIGLDGYWAPTGVSSEPAAVVMSIPGALSTSTTARVLLPRDIEAVGIRAHLATAGSGTTTVDLAVNGRVVQTLTFASGAKTPTYSGTAGVQISGYMGQVLTLTPTAVGSGASDLSFSLR